MPPNRIFLVDDNSDDNLYHRLVLEEILPDTEVLTFESGAAALAFFRGPTNTGPTGPGLVLVDLNMPAMDGWEFIDAFVETPASDQVELAVLSTTENPAELKRAEEHPSVSGFMAKPLSGSKLKILASRRDLTKRRAAGRLAAQWPLPSRNGPAESA